jgi:ubiquinone/menaquinone biosynthesis C-methylase UbiE
VLKSELIQVFDSQGEAYKRAFQIFLAHTDQKRNAKRFLQKLVDGLPDRNIFIDAGAGNGEVTMAFTGAFNRTIAIEPNPYLLAQLKQAIPQATAIAAPILRADPKAQADFVLCSHTLYYIPAEEWFANLERLVSWMSPGGVTVVVVQNHNTSCMAMLDHFFGHRFDLHHLAQAFREKHGDRYDVTITLDPAHVETTDADSAYAIAEFVLNLLPTNRPPTRRDVENYLSKHCLTDGTYRLSVHQDFLQISERGVRV